MARMLRLVAVLISLAAANVGAQQVSIMRRDTLDTLHDKDIAVSGKGTLVGAKVREHLQQGPNPNGMQPASLGGYNNTPGMFMGGCYNAGCTGVDCEITYRDKALQSFVDVDSGWLNIMNSASEMDGQRVAAANFQNVSIGMQCPGTRKSLPLVNNTLRECVEAVVKDTGCSKYFDVEVATDVARIDKCHCMEKSGDEVPPNCPTVQCDQPSSIADAWNRVCAYRIINPHLTAC